MQNIRRLIPNLLRRVDDWYFRKIFHLTWNWSGQKTNIGNDHMAIPSLVYFYVLSRVKRTTSKPFDTLIDIGSGTGKMVFLASKYSNFRAYGIENENFLVQISRENLLQLGSHSEIYLANALLFDYSKFKGDYLIFTLFNPFSPTYLTDFLSQISKKMEPNKKLAFLLFWDATWIEELTSSRLSCVWRNRFLRCSFWEYPGG